MAGIGNSIGDQAMLEYTTIDNPYPSFGLILHHTDAKREYACDANPNGSLDPKCFDPRRGPPSPGNVQLPNTYLSRETAA